MAIQPIHVPVKIHRCVCEHCGHRWIPDLVENEDGTLECPVPTYCPKKGCKTARWNKKPKKNEEK